MDIQWVYGIDLKKGEKMENNCKCPFGNETD